MTDAPVKPNTRYAQTYRNRLRAEGRCTRCRAVHDTGKYMCPECTQAKKDRQKRLRIRRRNAGLCVRCGRAAWNGLTLCELHAEKRADIEYKTYRRVTKGSRRHHCSLCDSPNHTLRRCPIAAAMDCECGAPKEPRERSCPTCTDADRVRRHPALEALADLGRATITDIAGRAGIKPNTAEVFLLRCKARGEVEIVDDDEHDLAEVLWRVAR